ncbi:PaaI family thioesterase [Chitinophaga solisilvae]|uniref:PaaI family thioesterase n=1 Tax=Chitinophaga solisilvae TaxID=1233460 RepID=UPI001370E587|nr:PaaI family thioesterase [Chitinophaga solisilvae]
MEIVPLRPDIEQRVRASFGRQKLLALYGAGITGIGKGYFEVSLPPSELVLRPAGFFVGGVIAGVADAVAGYTAATVPLEDPYFVTVEFKINFLNPAQGELLIVRGNVIKHGMSLTIVQVDVYTTAGGQETHAAIALVTMMRINKK